ncbi:hypothetical protein AAHA92_31055 [Salvia divinorum]|uniref:Uncharacterized protein n=1 Tax=Salvia divinorum TaxID=28513 RepID=A0ABD1FSZ4_SALDI
MNSNEEIIPSYLLDRIMAICNRIDKRLDEYEKFPPSYTTPTISYHEQPSWPVIAVVPQPPFACTDLYAPVQNPYAGYTPWQPDYQPSYVQPQNSSAGYQWWQHEYQAPQHPYQPPTSHRHSATAPLPLPAAAAVPTVPPPPAMISPPCSLDRIDTLSTKPLSAAVLPPADQAADLL